MIAADTSTWIAFLQGGTGDDVEELDQAGGSAIPFGRESRCMAVPLPPGLCATPCSS
jgi:hypothetical protein